MTTAFIINHGTSQTSRSHLENTVRWKKYLERSGFEVACVSGPGTFETAYRVSDTRRIPLHERPIEEIGDISLDIIPYHLGGVALGIGAEENVDLSLQIFRKFLTAGHDRIVLIGFSRGAYQLAILMQVLENEGLLGRIKVDVLLIDPVPGPYRQMLHKVPKGINKFKLMISQHEGRPGFAEAKFIVDPSVDFIGNVFAGKHGDLGGSTQSAMTRLAFADMWNWVFGKPQISTIDYANLALQATSEMSTYAKLRGIHTFSPRGIRSSTGIGLIDKFSLVMPSQYAGQLIAENSLVLQLLTGKRTHLTRDHLTRTDYTFMDIFSKINSPVSNSGEISVTHVLPQNSNLNKAGQIFHQQPKLKVLDPSLVKHALKLFNK